MQNTESLLDFQPTPVKPRPLFNFEPDEDYSGIWRSNPTGLIDLGNTNNPKARLYYKQMRLNFWAPYNFAASNYVKLQENGKVREIERVISYLSFLDSLQVRMLPEFARLIPDPEIKLVLSEHASQEAMHSESYEYMISNFPLHSREYIKTGVQTDPLLRKRCEAVIKPYQNYLDNPTPENLILAYFADYLVEGFLFESGFLFFYQNIDALSDSAIIVKLIQRDEQIHVRLFQYILKQALKDPLFKAVSKEMLVDYAYKTLEIENQWCKEIFCGDVPDEVLEAHNSWKLNTLLSAIGLEKLEQEKENPLKRLYRIGYAGDGSESRSNVLEIKSANYSNSDCLEWDF